MLDIVKNPENRFPITTFPCIAQSGAQTVLLCHDEDDPTNIIAFHLDGIYAGKAINNYETKKAILSSDSFILKNK